MVTNMVTTQHRYVIYLRQSGSVSVSVSKTLRLPPHGFASDPDTDTDTDSESNWATAAYAEYLPNMQPINLLSL
ncbi:hypothetical protein JCM31598_41020 [Desulfonatronum parangueonense]